MILTPPQNKKKRIPSLKSSKTIDPSVSPAKGTKPKEQNRSRGRPTKLTPKVQERICKAIRDGHHLDRACVFAGISYSTYREWMNHGEIDQQAGENTEFSDFLEAIKKADVDAEDRIIAFWRQAMPENWQAAAEFASRRWPTRWGRYNRVDLKHTGEITSDTTSKMDTRSIEEKAAATVSQYAEAFDEVYKKLQVQYGELQEDESG